MVRVDSTCKILQKIKIQIARQKGKFLLKL